jgi:hypothetical protein
MKLFAFALLAFSFAASGMTLDAVGCSSGERREHTMKVTRVDDQHFNVVHTINIDAPGAPNGDTPYQVEGTLTSEFVDLYYQVDGKKRSFLRGDGHNVFAFGSLELGCLTPIEEKCKAGFHCIGNSEDAQTWLVKVKRTLDEDQIVYTCSSETKANFKSLSDCQTAAHALGM